jgi:hypothetical protein
MAKTIKKAAPIKKSVVKKPKEKKVDFSKHYLKIEINATRQDEDNYDINIGLDIKSDSIFLTAALFNLFIKDVNIKTAARVALMAIELGEAE